MKSCCLKESILKTIQFTGDNRDEIAKAFVLTPAQLQLWKSDTGDIILRLFPPLQNAQEARPKDWLMLNTLSLYSVIKPETYDKYYQVLAI